VFERFARTTRLAVRSASEEAERRADPSIGTEHLLLGVAAVPSALVSKVLGVSLDDLRAGLDELDLSALASVGIEIDGAPAPGRGVSRRRPFTGGARQVLANAIRAAVGEGERSIEPEHLLLGILARPETDIALKLISRVGVDPHALAGLLEQEMRKSA
jgi:ATP-dependent Clp protease ATP-binding subunit ClpA